MAAVADLDLMQSILMERGWGMEPGSGTTASEAAQPWVILWGMRFYAEVLLALAVSGIGVIAALLGETDDAPGLVGIGCLLVAGAVLLGVRAGRRSR